MLNTPKQVKLTATAHSLPFYSATLMEAGVCPVSRIYISGIEKNTLSSLNVSIACKCGETEVISRRDFTYPSFCPDMYNQKGGALTLEFNFSDFRFDEIFLKNLTEEKNANVYILITYGKSLFTLNLDLLLLPSDVWQGLDCYPETLKCFVGTDDDYINEICSSIPQNMYADYKSHPEKLSESLKLLYTALKNKNIIYTRPTGYSAGQAQKIKSPKELFGSSSALATPLELALTFIACAAVCSFDTSLIFIRGVHGETSCFCGLWTKPSPMDRVLSEDIESICDYVKSGELVVVEPGVFAAAQNTSFSLAAQTSAKNVVGNAAEIVCMLDFSLTVNKEVSSDSFSKALSDIYAHLSDSPAIKYLNGDSVGRFSEIPLLVTKFDDFLCEVGSKYRLYPLDIGINLFDYAGLDEHFSSTLTAKKATLERYSATGDAAMRAKLDALKRRVSHEDGVTSALNEERLCEIAGHMTYANNGKKANAVLGYIRVTDKLNGEFFFVPMSFCPCDVTKQGGVYYISKKAHSLVNKVFVKNALQRMGVNYDTFMKTDMPTKTPAIFELFESVTDKLTQAGDRYSYSLVKEAHIVFFDDSDYYLWNDLSFLKTKITGSKAVRRIFENDGTAPKKISTEPAENTYISDKESMQAVEYADNALVCSYFADEKKKYVSALVKKHITDGKTLLITAKDQISAENIYNELKKDGTLYGVYLANDTDGARDLYSALSDSIFSENMPAENTIATMPQDYFEVAKILDAYENKLKDRRIFDITIVEALENYLEAKPSENFKELEIDKAVFDSDDKELLNSLFTDATELIEGAKRLCRASGLVEHTPINTHALFGTRPKRSLDKQSVERIKALGANILPVLSEYRDTFFDVSDITGIEMHFVKTLDALEALNELYRLALSARDVEIPENFRECDIERFTSSQKNISSLKERCKAIEFKLSFFEKEIFEDIETVLAGSKNDDGDKGFLKKFIHRKNDEDKLMQYIDAANVPAFHSKNIDEVYKLLYEYKSNVIKLRAFSNDDFGFSKQLALLSSKVSLLLDRITNQNRNALLSGFFKLVTLIPADPSLARALTVTRAHLAELFSDGEFSINELCSSLVANIRTMRWENGILSFDGIAKFISGAVGSLDVTDSWISYNELCDRVKVRLSSFVEYIENHGADGNVDALFASSLLLPALEKIRRELLPEDELIRINHAKEAYIPLLLKVNERCLNNYKVSYFQSLIHLSKTVRAESLAVKGEISFKDYFKKHKSVINKAFPCIITSADILSRVLPEDALFDTAVCMDQAKCAYKMLPSLSFGKRFVLVNMSPTRKSSLSKSVAASDVQQFNVGNITHNKNQSIFAYLNARVFENKCCLVNDDNSSAESIKVNGTYNKPARINKTQSELAISKACELLAANSKRVAIVCFTENMCEYTHKTAFSLQKKNKLLEKALDYNMIDFVLPSQLGFCDAENVVVCTTVGDDRFYGKVLDAALGGGSTKTMSDAYVEIGTKSFENLVFITNVAEQEKYIKAERREYLDKLFFSQFIDTLCTPKIASVKESGLVSGLIKVQGENKRFVGCCGKDNCGASLVSKDDSQKLYVFCDGDQSSIHNELLLKYYVSQNASVLSISPAMTENI